MKNVTEDLVRQNGNQAAAIMADYASQGGGGGGGTDDTSASTIVWTGNYIRLVDFNMSGYSAGDALVPANTSLNLKVPFGSEEEAVLFGREAVKKIVRANRMRPLISPFYFEGSTEAFAPVLDPEYSHDGLIDLAHFGVSDEASADYVQVSTKLDETDNIYFITKIQMDGYDPLYDTFYAGATSWLDYNTYYNFMAIPYRNSEGDIILPENTMAVNAKNTVYVDYVEGETSFELPSDITEFVIINMVDGYCLMPNVVLRKKDSENTIFIEAFRANNVRVTRDDNGSNGPQLTATYLEISFSETKLDSYTTVTAVVSYEGSPSPKCAIYEGEL